MPMTFEQQKNNERKGTVKTGAQQLGGATDATDYVRFSDADILLSISGPATAITGVIERSPIDPASPYFVSTNWAPMQAADISGNPSTGMVPTYFTEPGVGYWRFRLKSKTGGNVLVALSGGGGL